MEMADGGAPAATGLTPLRGAIVVLALATAIIHIVLAIPLSVIGFYLNGLGYIGLLRSQTGIMRAPPASARRGPPPDSVGAVSFGAGLVGDVVPVPAGR
jgi:hypothetical protein